MVYWRSLWCGSASPLPRDSLQGKLCRARSGCAKGAVSTSWSLPGGQPGGGGAGEDQAGSQPGTFRLARLEPQSKSRPPVAVLAQGHLPWSFQQVPHGQSH